MPETKTTRSPVAVFRAPGDVTPVREPEPAAARPEPTFDRATTRACGQQIIDEMDIARDAQPTVSGVQVVDALTGVAMQIAECGCDCCATNAATIVATIDLEA